MVGVAAKTHFDHVIGLDELPRIAVQQPGVGLFDLPAVDKRLAKNAKLIADAVADRRQIKRCQRIHKTGGEAAQATVAQPWLRLQFEELLQSSAKVSGKLFGQLGHAGVKQILSQLLAQHILGGEIVGEFGVGVVVRLGRLAPALRKQVAHGQRQRGVDIVPAGRLDRLADAVVEALSDSLMEFLLGQRGDASQGNCIGCGCNTHDASYWIGLRDSIIGGWNGVRLDDIL